MERLQDMATEKAKRFLVKGLHRYMRPEKQRQALIDYMRMSDSAKKLMSSSYRQEMEDLRRRFDGNTG